MQRKIVKGITQKQAALIEMIHEDLARWVWRTITNIASQFVTCVGEGGEVKTPCTFRLK